MKLKLGLHRLGYTQSAIQSRTISDKQENWEDGKHSLLKSWNTNRTYVIHPREMDRVFKKIKEGMEIFDTLYERHQTTSSSSQRDKLESELKKEIKKLQRFREQVKNWQTASEVKEKDKLLEYRKLVERAMEQYKEVERGSKSKAYSNEALADAGEEKEDNEATRFVQKALDELQRQQEMLEAKLEKLDSGRRGRRSNPEVESRKQEIETTLGHHHWHTQKLELILRLLENKVLNPDDVMAISDDLQYYLEDNQDPDFVNDDTMYDELDLDADVAIAHEVHSTFGEGVSAKKEDDDKEEDKKSNEKNGQHEQKKESSVSSGISRSSSSNSTNNGGGSHVTFGVRSSSRSKSGSPAPARVSRTNSGRNTPLHNYRLRTSSSVSSSSGVPTMANLRPAPVPKPAADLKWSAAVAMSSGVGGKSEGGDASAMKAASATATATANGNGNGNATATSATPSTSKFSQPSAASSGMNLNALNAASVLEALKRQRPKDLAAKAPSSTSGASTASSSRNGGSAETATAATSHTATPGNTSGPDEAFRTEKDTVCRPAIKINGGGGVPSSVSTSVHTQGPAEGCRIGPTPRELGVQQDESFRFLPAGLQNMLLSSAVARDRQKSGKKPACVDLRTMLSTPRSFSPLPGFVYPPGLEAQRVSTVWNQVRVSKNIDADAQNVDTATLFFAYYYGLSQREREVAYQVLVARQWRCSKDRTVWYQRHSPVKARGEGFEIADYNVFSAADWSLSEKPNYKVSY